MLALCVQKLRELGLGLEPSTPTAPQKEARTSRMPAQKRSLRCVSAGPASSIPPIVPVEARPCSAAALHAAALLNCKLQDAGTLSARQHRRSQQSYCELLAHCPLTSRGVLDSHTARLCNGFHQHSPYHQVPSRLLSRVCGHAVGRCRQRS